MTAHRFLNVPEVEAAHFDRNFITQAVCELRFPTLFELDSPKPPLAMAQALRKEYPTYERLNDVNVGPGGVAQANVHAFRSKHGHWRVVVRTSAITLETTRYDSFKDFQARLELLLKAAEKTIDSNFFTRVGLRYINTIPFGEDDIRQWVNPELVGALGAGVYGDVQEHSQRVGGQTEVGGFLFQHGLAIDNQQQKRRYVLDFDFFSEDVPVSEAIKISSALHEQEFAMFCWALGPNAKRHLGPSTLNSSEGAR